MTEESNEDFTESAIEQAPKTHTFTEEQLGSLLARARREGADRAKRRSEQAQPQSAYYDSPASNAQRDSSNVEEMVQQKVLQVLNELGEHSKKQEEERESAYRQQREKELKEKGMAQGRYYEAKLMERINADPEFKKLIDIDNPSSVARNQAVFQLALERPADQMADLVGELAKNKDLLDEVVAHQETRYSQHSSEAQKERAKRLLEKKLNNHFKAQEKPSIKNAPLEKINTTPASPSETPSTARGFYELFKNKYGSGQG